MNYLNKEEYQHKNVKIYLKIIIKYLLSIHYYPLMENSRDFTFKYIRYSRLH